MTVITNTPGSSRKEEFILILRLMTKKKKRQKKLIDGCVNVDIFTLQAKELSHEAESCSQH